MFPKRLFVESTTRCNLRCRMCVKQTAEHEMVEGDLAPETFARLHPALPHAESLVLSGIGEPLMNPHLSRYISEARSLMADNAWIGFQTNGLLLDRERAGQLVSAGVDRVCLSLDAVSPDTLGHIRGGASLGDISGALAAMREASEGSGRQVRLGLEFVAMRENIEELPGVIRWAAGQGVDFMIVTQCLPYDESIVSQTAYDPNTDIAVGFFEPWSARAREEGIELGRYFEVLWKYIKTKEDERIVAFVERMKAEAAERDIFINVGELLRRDEQWYARVARLLDEARALGEETGLELTLPEVYPKGSRSCDFIENDGVFISWNGEVHPCYFLWHGYRCFVNGREKFVKPKVFGNVLEEGLEGIWDGAVYREFRQSVKRYDFPFCSDCNLGKCCDYIQAEEFEQDCYINHEPCGDCLWCKGIFNCLQ